MGELEFGNVIRMSSAPESGPEQASPTTRLDGIREQESFQAFIRLASKKLRSSWERKGIYEVARVHRQALESASCYPPPTYVDILKLTSLMGL